MSLQACKLIWIFSLISQLLLISCAETTTCGNPISAFGLWKSRVPRIVNGSKCFEGEFPWMVSLKFKDGAQDHFCAGFLVSQSAVLSAAHCFRPSQLFNRVSKKVNNFIATVGEYNLKSNDEADVEVDDVLVYPGYKKDVSNNGDLAIVKLKGSITEVTGQRVVAAPICLPSAHFVLPKNATVAGWGQTNYWEDHELWRTSTDILKKSDVELWEQNSCIKKYNLTKVRGLPTKGFICAGQPGGRTCRGDSGGPLMVRKDEIWTAVGLVSGGSACGDDGHPGYYTDLQYYLSWINENLV